MDGNEKGERLEREVFELLGTLQDEFPELIELVRHPTIELRSSARRRRVADIDFRIHLPGITMLYLIECRDRQRQAMDIVYRIQDVRLNSNRNTFIFVHRDPLGPLLLEELTAHGIIRFNLDELAEQLDYWRSVLATLDPSDWDIKQNHLQTSVVRIKISKIPGSRDLPSRLHWKRLENQPILGYERRDDQEGPRFHPTPRISAMNPDAAIKMLRRSPSGVVEWNRRREGDPGPIDLMDADLSSLDLRTIDLAEANLQRANLSGADLRGARLVLADLERANLRNAKLGEADLDSIGCRGADFRGADLETSRNLNLYDVGLSAIPEVVAIIDTATILPPGMQRPG